MRHIGIVRHLCRAYSCVAKLDVNDMEIDTLGGVFDDQVLVFQQQVHP